MTIKDLWNKWMDYQDDKVKITTKRGYHHARKYIEPVFNIKCSEFNIVHFEAWKKYMVGITSMNNVSKKDKLKVFVAMLHYGVKMYNYPFDQTIRLITKFTDPNELKKEMEIYSPTEFKQFLSAEDKLVYRCLWEILYYCGLRIGEARGLTWADIDWNDKKLSINKQVQSLDNYSANFFISSLKTKSSYRKLPICQNLYDDLISYHTIVKQFANYSDELFVFGEDFGIIPLTYQKARRRKKSLSASAGVKEIRLHDFRHSCVSLLISKCLPINVVSKYMGHATATETLNTYSHLFENSMNDAVKVMDEINIEIDDE